MTEDERPRTESGFGDQSPYDLYELGDRAIRLVEREDYRAAAAVLDQLFERGCVAPALVVAYAVCLSELGESETDPGFSVSLNWSS